MHVPMIHLRMQKNTASILILKLIDVKGLKDQMTTLTMILSKMSGIANTQRSSEKLNLINQINQQIQFHSIQLKMSKKRRMKKKELGG